MLRAFEPDGRLRHVEWFATDRAEQALARFDELTAPLAPARRVRANAATAHAARMDAAVAARDLDAFLALLADDAQAVHHQTGTLYAEREARRAYEIMLANESLAFSHEPLATLGDTLALCRGNLSIGVSQAEDLPFGASNMDSLVLMEVDASGRRRATEFFALDKLADALCRLYERHAELLPEGPERARAAATARSVATLMKLPDDRYGSALSPTVELADHRMLGTWSARGAEAMLRGIRALAELSADMSVRVDEVFGLDPRGYLVLWTTSGTDRTGGGAYERPFLMLCVFGSDGLLARCENFDTDDIREALARFDELTAEAPVPRFANAASRALDRLGELWCRRSVGDVAALLAPDFRNADRRAILASELDRDAFLASYGPLLEQPTRIESKNDLLATRGERLALARVLDRGHPEVGRDGPGPFEIEFLQILEVDAAGRIERSIVFDPSDLDAAYAELDRRYADGEGAPHAALLAHWAAFRAANNARDWDTARRLLPDALHMQSHRRLANSGMRLGRDAFIEGLSWGDRGDVRVRATLRRDHLRLSASAAFEIVTLLGDLDGGAFEQEFVLVFAHDGSRLRSCEAFDLEELDAALAHSEALSREPAAVAQIETAVTRAEAALKRAWEARDWEAIGALTPADFRSIDRRPLMHLELDRDAILGGIRPLFERGVTRSSELLATRGEHLALYRVRFQGSDELAGPSEVEFVQVIETDANGSRLVGIAFAPGDLDAAYAELDERYHAGEAAPYASVAAGMREFSRAFAARDWDALAARCAREIVVHDHRLLGWESLHGPAAYVGALQALVELAPDTRLRLDHVAMAERGYLVLTVWVGTREGGAFEEPSLMVAELDDAMRIRRFDWYDLERQGEARARFAEVAASAARDPLRIPPNAAMRVLDRWSEAAIARDWDTLERLFAPDFGYEDRRRGIQDSGDLAKMLASIRVALEAGARATHEVLATAGDRLAMTRGRFTISDGETVVAEIDVLQINELDAAGRVVAAVTFDPDDRRAASIEMLDRWFRSDEAPRAAATGLAPMRALFDHDVEPLAASLPDDFFVDDHRRFGMGRVEGAGAFIQSFAALFEQSADLVIEGLYTVATSEHAILDMAHMVGTLDASGGDFESVYLRLLIFRGDRLAALELFEAEDLDAARARFEALRGDPA
jgi:ketosteroid isomerase-like protein